MKEDNFQQFNAEGNEIINTLNKKWIEEKNKNIELININEKNEKIIREKQEQIEQHQKKLLDLEAKNQELNKIIEEKNNIIKAKEEFIKNNEIIVTNKDDLEKIKKELDEKYGKLLNELNEELNKIKRKLNKEKEETDKINSLIENPEIKNKIKEDLENNIKASQKILEKREEIQLFVAQSFKKNQKEEIFYQIMDSIKKEYEYKLQNEIKSLTNQMKEMKEKIENEFNEKFEKREKEYASKFNKIYNKNDDSESELESEYSYECLNKKELVEKIYEGTDIAKFEIALKNNGDIKWDNNSQLRIVKPSVFTTNNIILKPQKPGDIIAYQIVFRDLKRYPSGEYKSYLEFYSADNCYGEKLEIKLNIMEK